MDANFFDLCFFGKAVSGPSPKSDIIRSFIIKLKEKGKEITCCPFCGNAFNFENSVLKRDTKTISEESFFCEKCNTDLLEIFSPGKELDFCRALHAEENAILSNPYLGSGKELIIFATTFPCMLCAKKIANTGIKKVVFVEPYPVEESYEIFFENDINIEIFEGVKSLSFNWIFRKRANYIKSTAFNRLKQLKSLTEGEQ